MWITLRNYRKYEWKRIKNGSNSNTQTFSLSNVWNNCVFIG